MGLHVRPANASTGQRLLGRGAMTGFGGAGIGAELRLTFPPKVEPTLEAPKLAFEDDHIGRGHLLPRLGSVVAASRSFRAASTDAFAWSSSV